MQTHIKHVTVVGAGVLGAQIAYQCAFAGFDVVSYDINEEALQTAKKRFAKLDGIYSKNLDVTEETIKAINRRLVQSCQLAQSVANADLIIECVPEDLQLKQKVWADIGNHTKDHCIFTTNTSTLLPSKFSAASGDESRFLALHFANDIWRMRIVEVMGTPQTNPNTVNTTFEFAKAMQMSPVIIKKEQPGYIMNSLLAPFLHAACGLYAKEVAEPADIDKVWKLATGSPKGPFEIMDLIGLRTLYAVTAARAQQTGDPVTKKFVDILKNDFLAQGKTGRESGSGFYDYDEQGKLL